MKFFNARRLFVLLTFLGSLVFAQEGYAHKYATHNFDARISGKRINFEYQVDTISTIELIQGKKPDFDGMKRPNAIEHRDMVYAYLNDHFIVENNGKRCNPSKLFNFEYTHKVDKYTIRYYLLCEEEADLLTFNFSLFIEQVGMNTTIGTIMGPKGGDRYVFTDRSRATVRVSELTGSPRRVKDLMKNYDPSKGFRSESERLRALGKAAEVVERKSENEIAKSKGDVQVAEKMGSGFTVFLVQGINHILSGLDHVLFVLCLVIAVYGWKQLGVVITSFTIAHSISLGLATFGLVKVSPNIVEPLIALSILYVAIENVVREKPTARAAVTFGFGLIHGLGFSAVLQNILPNSDIAPALFGFNLGVELGQLMIVIPLFPLLVWLKKKKKKTQTIVVNTVCICVALAAGYWLVQRIIALVSG